MLENKPEQQGHGVTVQIPENGFLDYAAVNGEIGHLCGNAFPVMVDNGAPFQHLIRAHCGFSGEFPGIAGHGIGADPDTRVDCGLGIPCPVSGRMPGIPDKEVVHHGLVNLQQTVNAIEFPVVHQNKIQHLAEVLTAVADGCIQGAFALSALIDIVLNVCDPDRDMVFIFNVDETDIPDGGV